MSYQSLAELKALYRQQYSDLKRQEYQLKKQSKQTKRQHHEHRKL